MPTLGFLALLYQLTTKRATDSSLSLSVICNLFTIATVGWVPVASQSCSHKICILMQKAVAQRCKLMRHIEDRQRR